MMKSINKMRSYYRAILGEVGLAYNLNKEDIHEMLKVGYNIESTTILDYDGRYEYIENVLYFMMCIFDMIFDSYGYQTENISRVRLYGTMRPDNFYLLF